MHNQLSTEVIQKLKNSDKDAFKIIFDEFYDSVFNNIYFKTKDYEIARDLAQETFIKCWDNRENIDNTKSLYFWLITIASNLTTNHFKRTQMLNRHHNIIKNEGSNAYAHVSEQMEANQLQQQIDEIIAKYLPAKCQTIFIMSRFEGKSNSDIAEELSISKKTVENQLFEGLKIIRKKIKKTIGVFNYSFVLI